MAELQNLDALADQLYHEGVGKAEKEAKKLLEQANKKGEEILLDAQKEAKEIVTKAQKEAEKHRSAVESEIQQKAKQALQDLKTQIEHLITSKLLDDSSKQVLAETDFIKELILTAMENWTDGQDLELKIPEKVKQIRADLEKKIHNYLPELKISLNNHIDAGFIIENNGKGYILSFTSQDFKALFEPYLTDVVSKILFDSKE